MSTTKRPPAPSQPGGTMSCWSVRALGAALVHAGVDLGVALAEVGISAEELSEPDGRIDLQRAQAFFEAAPRWTNDPHFGLRGPSHVPIGAARALDYGLRSCSTVGEALEQLARYYMVVNDRAGLSIERGAEHFTLHFLPSSPAASRIAKEFLFSFILRRGQAFTGAPVPLRRIDFRHAPPPDPEEQERIVGAPVRFEQPVDRLVFAPEFQDAPLITRDPGLCDLLLSGLDAQRERLGAGPDPLADIKACVSVLISTGSPALEIVAKKMAMSARTLQRRLQQAGTSFSDLVAAVQQALAVQYLGDDTLTVSEVAYLVGFSDTTSFHRAFRRWTGKTPGETRSAGAAHRTRA